MRWLGRGLTGRSGLGLAVGSCLSGAALLGLAAGRTWARAAPPATAEDLATGPALALPGHALAPALTVLALAAAAGVAGLLAVRGRARILVGAVLVALGLIAATTSWRVDPEAVRAAAGERRPGVSAESVSITTTWRWSGVGAGSLLIVAGVLTAGWGRGWPVLGGRYDAPTRSGQRRPVDRAAAAWEALDRGEDPTS